MEKTETQIDMERQMKELREEMTFLKEHIWDIEINVID
jgi:hypothetical protein